MLDFHKAREWLVKLSTQANKIITSKKVKASHTRYQALGPELTPVYRQSARR